MTPTMQQMKSGDPHATAAWLERVCRAEQERGQRSAEYTAALKAAEEALKALRRFW